MACAQSYESQGLLHEMFLQQAHKTPGNIAVVSPGEGKQMTYRELESATEVLAITLHRHGVKENCIVGVYMEKCIDFIISCMATLRAGK